MYINIICGILVSVSTKEWLKQIQDVIDGQELSMEFVDEKLVLRTVSLLMKHLESCNCIHVLTKPQRNEQKDWNNGQHDTRWNSTLPILHSSNYMYFSPQRFQVSQAQEGQKSQLHTPSGAIFSFPRAERARHLKDLQIHPIRLRKSDHEGKWSSRPCNTV